MTNPILTQLIANERQHQFAANAARRRLIALATCCRPSRLVAAAQALRARLRVSARAMPCCA